MTENKLTPQLKQELETIVEKLEGTVEYYDCLTSRKETSKKIMICYDVSV